MDFPQPKIENGEHAAYEPFGFIAGLENSKLGAIKTALKFLTKAPGNKPTLGTLEGVDEIKLECVREFASLTRTLREWEFLFEENWGNPVNQRKIMDTLDPSNKLHRKKDNKDVYKSIWISEARKRISIESSSADFRLSFMGAVGNWSVTFVVGCTGIYNSPQLCDITEFLTDKDFDK